MRPFRKKVFATAGYNTTYFGSGRKEFNPRKPMPRFEAYLQEAGEGCAKHVQNPEFDEGIIANFMAARFIKQANLPGFLPFMAPSLQERPCTSVEGACGSGGRAIAHAVRSILSDEIDTVFVAGFEVQNTMKAVYGADVLSGASYYDKERKQGHAFFFPGIFAERAGAYYNQYGYEPTRSGMAHWYQMAIENARKNPKAQEYHNITPNLIEKGMTPPDPKRFLPHLNHFDCSKVSDGASAIVISSEEGLKRLGVDKENAIEIIAVGGAVGDITQPPKRPTLFSNTAAASRQAFEQAKIGVEDLGLLEIHDCFSISAIMALEAIGVAQPGQAPNTICEGHLRPQGVLPTNLSGGLCGFGHPVGASGVRMLVDLWQQLTGQAPNQVLQKKPHGLLVSMGGNDITVTAVVVKATK